MLTIEIKWNTVLVERQTFRGMGRELVFVQVGYADRGHLRGIAFVASILHVDSEHTVEVAMHECK